MTVPTNASAGNPLFDEHEGTLRRALGLPSLVLFGLVYMVPLTVFTTYFVDRRERAGGAVLSFLILPLVGFVLTLWLWTSLSRLTLIVGVCWLGIGFLWLLGVTRGFRRPTPVLDIEDD